MGITKRNGITKITTWIVIMAMTMTTVLFHGDVAQAANAKITLNKSEATVLVGKSITLKVKSVKGLKNKTVKWNSSNKKVAKVDSKGRVTGIKAGTATITATSKVNSKIKANCKITVAKTKAESIVLDKTACVIVKGKTTTVKVKSVLPEGASKNVEWSVAKSTIASIKENGSSVEITGKKAGKTTLTATATDRSKVKAKVDIVVVDKTSKIKKVTSIKVTAPKVELVPGESTKAKAVVKPSNATMKTVLWTSGNQKVATVDKNGMITAIKEGKVKITATAQDGSKKKSSITIVVKDKPSVTKAPVNTVTPKPTTAVTKAPQNTMIPSASAAPKPSSEPGISPSPVPEITVTEAPTPTSGKEPTSKPEEKLTPKPSSEPNPTTLPKPSTVPTITLNPTKSGEPTNSVVPSQKPLSPTDTEKLSPTPTNEPTSTVKPSPTVTNEPTSTIKPSPTVTSEPTSTVKPSPTVTSEPTSTVKPSPTVTSEPTSTVKPSPTVTSEPTSTVKPSPTVTSEPASTKKPSPTVTSEPTSTKKPSPTVTSEPTSTQKPSPTAISEPTSTPEPTGIVTSPDVPTLPKYQVQQMDADTIYVYGQRLAGIEFQIQREGMEAENISYDIYDGEKYILNNEQFPLNVSWTLKILVLQYNEQTEEDEECVIGEYQMLYQKVPVKNIDIKGSTEIEIVFLKAEGISLDNITYSLKDKENNNVSCQVTEREDEDFYIHQLSFDEALEKEKEYVLTITQPDSEFEAYVDTIVVHACGSIAANLVCHTEEGEVSNISVDYPLITLYQDNIILKEFWLDEDSFKIDNIPVGEYTMEVTSLSFWAPKKIEHVIVKEEETTWLGTENKLLLQYGWTSLKILNHETVAQGEIVGYLEKSPLYVKPGTTNNQFLNMVKAGSCGSIVLIKDGEECTESDEFELTTGIEVRVYSEAGYLNQIWGVEIDDGEKFLKAGIEAVYLAPGSKEDTVKLCNVLDGMKYVIVSKDNEIVGTPIEINTNEDVDNISVVRTDKVIVYVGEDALAEDVCKCELEAADDITGAEAPQEGTDYVIDYENRTIKPLFKKGEKRAIECAIYDNGDWETEYPWNNYEWNYDAGFEVEEDGTYKAKEVERGAQWLYVRFAPTEEKAPSKCSKKYIYVEAPEVSIKWKTAKNIEGKVYNTYTFTGETGETYEYYWAVTDDDSINEEEIKVLEGDTISVLADAGMQYCYVRIAAKEQTFASQWQTVKLPSGDNEFNASDIP